MNTVVPEGKIARSTVAGVAAVKVGLGELKHKIKRPFLSEEKQESEKNLLDDKNAKLLFKALTQLRGTALKLAQMVGMEQGLLPEAYQKELSKSFHQVPSLNRVLVRKVFMGEFTHSPNDVFEQFESQAFAAASLGQVHRATLLDGSKVAVKVQYPGISVSIKSDLTLIRGIARGLPNTHLILQSLDEVEARLMEEIDYTIEASNTQWFDKRITLEGIKVPKVHTDYSTQRILTTELISGLHLNEWLVTNPSQDERNRIGQLLYDFFIHSTKDLLCLHADPNPGNYLIHNDSSITVIDFGCVKHLTKEFTHIFPQLINAYMNDNPGTLFSTYKKIGMTFDKIDEDIYQKVLRPFGQWVSLPFKTESFDFAKNRNYTSQGQEPMKHLHDNLKVDNIATEFIFHNRTIYGLFQIFEKIGATVKMREQMFS